MRNDRLCPSNLIVAVSLPPIFADPSRALVVGQSSGPMKLTQSMSVVRVRTKANIMHSLCSLYFPLDVALHFSLKIVWAKHVEIIIIIKDTDIAAIQIFSMPRSTWWNDYYFMVMWWLLWGQRMVLDNNKLIMIISRSSNVKYFWLINRS